MIPLRHYPSCFLSGSCLAYSRVTLSALPMSADHNQHKTAQWLGCSSTHAYKYVCATQYNRRYQSNLSLRLAPYATYKHPHNPVSDTCCHIDVIACRQGHNSPIFKLKPPLPFEHHHPFILGLIVPANIGRAMSIGQNALDSNIARGQNLFENLIREVSWHFRKYIGHGFTQLHKGLLCCTHPPP